jgi:hypothetical protein
MLDDVSNVRLILTEIVVRAEADEAFRQRLADVSKTLADFGITKDMMDGFSRSVPMAGPTDCIHTNGCNDGTCWSSSCGVSCYITIHGAPPDQ